MLAKFDKSTNPFKIPENYFENLNTEIINQLTENKIQVKKISLWKKIVPWSAIAAALIGTIFYLEILTDNSSSSMKQTSSLTEDDIFQYMEEEVINSSYNDMLYSDSYN